MTCKPSLTSWHPLPPSITHTSTPLRTSMTVSLPQLTHVFNMFNWILITKALNPTLLRGFSVAILCWNGNYFVLTCGRLVSALWNVFPLCSRVNVVSVDTNIATYKSEQRGGREWRHGWLCNSRGSMWSVWDAQEPNAVRWVWNPSTLGWTQTDTAASHTTPTIARTEFQAHIKSVPHGWDWTHLNFFQGWNIIFGFSYF